MMAGCSELRVRGSAYCPNHFNEALLRKWNRRTRRCWTTSLTRRARP
jgi:hypothetical protein